MFKILNLFAFLLVVSSGICQDEFPNLVDEKTVTTITYFEVGDTRSYHVEKYKEDLKGNEEVTISGKTEYDLHFNVLEGTDSTYVIEMTYDNFEVPEEVAGQEWLQSILRISENLVIVYETNEVGQFLQILNKEELAKDYLKQIDIIEDKLAELTEDTDAINSLMEMTFANLRSMGEDPENMDILYGNEINTFHGMYGFEFEFGKSEMYETIYEVAPGLSLEGESKLKLKAILKSEDNFVITSDESPSKDELEKYMKQIFAMFIPAEALEKMDELKMDYKKNTSSVYEYELSTGWINKIQMVDVIKIKVENKTRETKTHVVIEQL